MTLNGHRKRFGGLPVAELHEIPRPTTTEANSAPSTPPDPRPRAGDAAWALRVGNSYRGHSITESFPDLFARFLETVDTTEVSAIVIGLWGDHNESAAVPIELLAAAADRLPALRHLCLGDIVAEENELSWIQQSDITPLLTAFPALETLIVAGGEDLHLDPVGHDALRVLEFLSAGLPAEFVRAVGASLFPTLRALDMWLGVERYYGDSTIEDLAGILNGEGLPMLTRLGLMNSEIQDEIAAAVAVAPILDRLTELDLSMGTLGDEGAAALLVGLPDAHLTHLNLRHHFISESLQQRLRDSLPGVRLDLDEEEEPYESADGETGRYVEVAE
ncbi:STM4015 family protein [Embleya sp. NPDC127516]|uniref:STM4015 family protein n=1 Tax=Embleya sp. NPDC127516 TaxID=3363990 RepID=UPI00381080C8